MKLSFTTRGWASLSFDMYADIASEMKFRGFELYDLFKHREMLEKGQPLHQYAVASTMRSLRDRKIEIANLDTSLDLGREESEENLLWTIRMAGMMKVEYVSAEVMTDDEDSFRNTLHKIVNACKQNGTSFLIKTRGIYVDTERLKNILDEFAEDCLGVLWDMHHPYKDHKESPDTTIKNLGGYVKLVHIRDIDEDGKYTIIGEGILPVKEFMRALSSIDYDGFVSLEWKPEWMEDVQDYEFIFPHFISYMSRFENTRENRRKLYLNHDGTGEYIWKKDELIDLTFPQVLDRVVEEFPNQYAFKYTTLDYTRTYEEFREDVDNFARALVSLGVKAGSKVAIWATNVPAWYITFWAATKIGAVLVTVNTAYKIHEAEYLFRQSDTHTVVMIENALDSNYRQIINEICPELKDNIPGEPLHAKRLPFLRNVITVGYRDSGCLTFEEAMERAPMVPKEQILYMASQVRTGDVCNMQYTSGTTGFPKGVMLTHYNVVNN
nr:AMP-binding protein [Solobacterium sp.]